MTAFAAELGARAVDTDQEERFLAFVNAHQDRAVRVAWRLLGGDEAAAEDVAQEAFFKAYRALGRFREDASLATWFYRILVNQTRKHRRWRAVRDRWSTLFGREEPGSDPAASPDPILRHRIAAALERLPQGQREAFVLVYLEGFTLSEAAQQQGKALGTVKSHLHRALAKLRADLEDLREPDQEKRQGLRK